MAAPQKAVWSRRRLWIDGAFVAAALLGASGWALLATHQNPAQPAPTPSVSALARHLGFSASPTAAATSALQKTATSLAGQINHHPICPPTPVA